MAKTLNLQIVTPEGKVYSDHVEIVVLRAPDGQIGILPNHRRLMTQMLRGEMMVRKEGRPQFLAVGEGLVEVTGESVSILTDMAVEAEN
ncbi:MAG: ATP synthase F1 subunit epsilon, partial [Pyrinomonadaceae bacterium]